ncbi:MAG: cytosine deaminase [Proteobacteria bacterium]|nr:cytosine deaminase [Pseudomonadota bacterium]
MPDSLLAPSDRAALPAAGKGLRSAHLCIADGRVRSLTAAQVPTEAPQFDLRDGVVTSAWVEAHTHLDKSHIGPRTGRDDNSLQEAIAVAGQDRAGWTEADLLHRMDFSLRAALAHGTRALRTHLDWTSAPPPLAWRVAQGLRNTWAGRIELQLSSICPLPLFADGPAGKAVAHAVAQGQGVLGASVHPMPGQRDLLARVFALARDTDLDLDFHVDEHLQDNTEGMRTIADLTLRHGMEGRVVCGHCCALGTLEAADLHVLLGRFAQAGIQMVSLPLANLQLQDRQPGRTPRLRGIAPLREAAAAGVPVSIASDNVRDPYVPYADLDLLQVLTVTALAAQLPDPIEQWISSITCEPARALRLDWDGILRPGCPADLVVLAGRSSHEICSRPQAARRVMRGGRWSESALPDYRELDV